MTISASIVADSISPDGIRITTFELEYPRWIHGELMAHRMFSRNAASSRAIPVSKSIELIRSNPAMPVHWGKNQPGMSAKEEVADKEVVERMWREAAERVADIAESFHEMGLHKQLANRWSEPASHIKVVLTATEFENFWWLRDHKDAQPEIAELARVMREEYNKSEPARLCQGEWHVPYYRNGIWQAEACALVDIEGFTLKEALAISASCCAQVSYRKLDASLEKAADIFKRLIESEPCHSSPSEHQATPMHESRFRSDDQVLLYVDPENQTLDSRGITHFDRYGWAWSGNLRGWLQHRQLIPNNAKYG